MIKISKKVLKEVYPIKQSLMASDLIPAINQAIT